MKNKYNQNNYIGLMLDYKTILLDVEHPITGGTRFPREIPSIGNPDSHNSEEEFFRVKPIVS